MSYADLYEVLTRGQQSLVEPKGFPETTGKLDPEHPTLSDNGFPPEKWLGKVDKYLDRKKNKIHFPNDREKYIMTARRNITSRLDDQQPGGDDTADNLAKALTDSLTAGYPLDKPSDTEDLRFRTLKADIEQGVILLKAVFKHGMDKGKINHTDLLKAVDQLPPEQQDLLFLADRRNGNKLYNALYEANKTGDNAVKASFQKLDVVAKNARVIDQLLKGDPSGEVAWVYKDFSAQLKTSNVRPECLDGFIKRMALKMSVEEGFHEFENIGNNKSDFRAMASVQFLQVFAESETTSNQDILDALNGMDKAETLKAVSYLSVPPWRDGINSIQKEGAHRVLEVIELSTVNETDQSNPELANLHRIAKNINRGYYNAAKFRELAKQGKDVSTIQAELEHAAGEESKKTATNFANRVETTLGVLNKKLEALDENTPEHKGDIDAIKQFKAIFDGFGDLMATEDGPKLCDEVFRRFGFAPFCGYLDGSALTARIDPEASLSDLRKGPMEGLAQFGLQLNVQHKPALLEAGLEKMTAALPTVNKDLRKFPWLQNVVRDFKEMADLIRSKPVDEGGNPNFDLKQHPIVIIDQSDVSNPGLFQRNQQFCDELENDFGVKITHIPMGDITTAITGSGLEKLFDTTGTGNPGYGGARNMTFMLAPVIQELAKKGKNLRDVDPNKLAKLVKKHALDNTKKTFQGDDTDRLSPGAMFSKAMLVQLHAEDHCTMVTPRGGRDTMGINAVLGSGLGGLSESGLERFKAGKFATKWNAKLARPGMGCSLSGARFCLDLPLGSEERHDDTGAAVDDCISNASHDSGDRLQPLSDHLKGFIPYSVTSGLARDLVVDNGALTWNAESERRKKAGEKGFEDGQDVLDFASQPEQIKKSQAALFKGLIDVKNDKGSSGPAFAQLRKDPAPVIDKYINDHPELPSDEVDELRKVKQVFQDNRTDALYCDEYLELLFRNIFKAIGDHLEPTLPVGAKLVRALDPKKPDKEAMTVIGNAIEQDYVDLATVIADTKVEFSNLKNIEFKNFRLLRDLSLTVESLGGGNFGKLAGKLV